MGRRARQNSFQGKGFKPLYEFGGSLHQNSNPKTKRPISTKHAMHVVLRSDIAKGALSLKKQQFKIKKIIKRQAALCHIKVYEQANVGNHIHLLIYLKANSYLYAKKCLSAFLRSISGLIARLILKAERNAAKGIKFWSKRPYTRVVAGFKREYQVARDYVIQNHLESIGVIPYQPRKMPKKAATHLKFV